ncbi:MAG: four helix bundle protein [Oscillospiraceae bacterium]|nr:four helix bundle protein [Oscillospiraceae bacterium]
MVVNHYRDLIVWQKAMKLVKEVYLLVKKLPKEELFSLSDQMRRAVVSIPSNIAEGQARESTKEFIHFLAIARGSKAEIQTQLLICIEIGYLSATDITEAMSLSEEVGKMLTALIRRLSH